MRYARWRRPAGTTAALARPAIDPRREVTPAPRREPADSRASPEDRDLSALKSRRARLREYSTLVPHRPEAFGERRVTSAPSRPSVASWPWQRASQPMKSSDRVAARFRGRSCRRADGTKGCRESWHSIAQGRRSGASHALSQERLPLLKASNRQAPHRPGALLHRGSGSRDERRSKGSGRFASRTHQAVPRPGPARRWPISPRPRGQYRRRREHFCHDASALISLARTRHPSQ